jgi:opacity protein-like surface antigen
MRHLSVVSLTLATALALPPAALDAQYVDGGVRGHLGGSVLIGVPVGEFAENVGTGYGLGGFGSWAFDPQGVASIRLDLGFLNYGRETIRICVTTPCRVTGDLTTSNNIVFGGLGPQITVGGRGPVRAYGTASVGFAYFATTSSVEGSNNNGDPFASDTNFDDATFAWTAGGGVQIRVSNGVKPVYLDFGARYHGNGEAEYLRKGDITDLPDGSVIINPRRSDTNLWTIRVGVSVGLGGGPVGY